MAVIKLEIHQNIVFNARCNITNWFSRERVLLISSGGDRSWNIQMQVAGPMTKNLWCVQRSTLKVYQSRK